VWISSDVPEEGQMALMVPLVAAQRIVSAPSTPYLLV
jgi:hypothetical protein